MAMNKKLRKIISLALTFVMLFTMLPMDVLADLITTDYSGGFTVRSIIPTPTDQRKILKSSKTVSILPSLMRRKRMVIALKAGSSEKSRFSLARRIR